MKSVFTNLISQNDFQLNEKVKFIVGFFFLFFFCTEIADDSEQ